MPAELSSRKIELGMGFGRWTVIACAPTRHTPSGSARQYWHCRCECGVRAEVQTAHLRSGRTKSCGCLRRELAGDRARTHGGRRTYLYDVWTQMLQRCGNPKNKAFADYGGRGIKVCERWLDFSNFIADMGPRPDGLTVERDDNNGDYSPGNCRWATNLEQSRNKRGTIFIEHEGALVSMAELAERHGLKYMTVYRRLRVRGEPVETLFRPVGKAMRRMAAP